MSDGRRFDFVGIIVGRREATALLFDEGVVERSTGRMATLRSGYSAASTVLRLVVNRL
jgi:hypothetical protein